MNTSSIIDQYPSTSDLPPIKGGQDPVLAILQGARKRYARRMTTGAYIGHGGTVCAVGAVAREAGMTSSSPGEGNIGEDFEGALASAHIERSVIRSAKTAIRLLNQSARKLFPASKHYKNEDGTSTSSWSGPLEWINQEYAPDDLPEPEYSDFMDIKRVWRKKVLKARKAAVLACYDDAIAKQTQKLAA